MSRYDGLIIPRSYSEYLNKTDAATLSQMLQLPGILDRELTAGSNKPITNEVIEGALAIPKDAVLHYSFDDIPNYPDGTSDVRYTNGNTYNIPVNANGTLTTDPYVDGDGKIHKSNINGNANYKMQLVPPNTSIGIFLNVTEYIGKVFILEINSKTNTLRPAFNYRVSGGSLQTIYPWGTVPLGKSKLIYFLPNYWTFCSITLYARTNNEVVDFEILNYYIGDGTYATPIIDNSGNSNNAVNNGGIVVSGISGKSAYFLSNKHADIGANLQLAQDFSIALWVKPDNNTNTLVGNILRKSAVLVLRNGNADYPKLTLDLYSESGSLFTNYELAPLLTPNVWTHIILVRRGTSLKFYLNGVLETAITLQNNTIATNNNTMTLCGATDEPNTRPQTIDDLLIFNRALSDIEVQALYLNKGNTPKWVNLNNYKLDNWIDITDQVIFTKTDKSATCLFVNPPKAWIKGSTVHFHITITNTTSISPGEDLCVISISSKLFTLPHELSRVFSVSYYGDSVNASGMNVYDDENGVITFRKGYGQMDGVIAAGFDMAFSADVPVLLS